MEQSRLLLDYYSMRLEDPVKILRKNINMLRTMRGAEMRSQGLLRELDKEGRMSGNKLARDAGVAQKAVSNLLREDWDGTPTVETVERIAMVFGLAAWQLMLPGLPMDKEINRALRNGIDEKACALAAAYTTMPTEAKREILTIVGYVMDRSPLHKGRELHQLIRKAAEGLV